MIYSKNMQLKLKTTMDCAKELLKNNTYPYCGSSKKNYDFIGTIIDDSFEIKIALNGPRELFKTVVYGNFKDINDGNVYIIAKINLSSETWKFILFFNSFLFALSIAFAIFDITKIIVPIIMFFIVNIVFSLVSRSILYTTKQLIERIYSLTII